MKRVVDKPLYYFVSVLLSSTVPWSSTVLEWNSLALRVHACTLFCLILSPGFSKGVMGRLIKRATVVWWFIKGME